MIIRKSNSLLKEFIHFYYPLNEEIYNEKIKSRQGFFKIVLNLLNALGLGNLILSLRNFYMKKKSLQRIYRDSPEYWSVEGRREEVMKAVYLFNLDDEVI